MRATQRRKVPRKWRTQLPKVGLETQSRGESLRLWAVGRGRFSSSPKGQRGPSFWLRKWWLQGSGKSCDRGLARKAAAPPTPAQGHRPALLQEEALGRRGAVPTLHPQVPRRPQAPPYPVPGRTSQEQTPEVGSYFTDRASGLGRHRMSQLPQPLLLLTQLQESSSQHSMRPWCSLV